MQEKKEREKERKYLTDGFVGYHITSRLLREREWGCWRGRGRVLKKVCGLGIVYEGFV